LTAALSASTFLNSTLQRRDNLSEKEHQSLQEDAGIVDGSLRFINDLLRSMLDVHKAASKKMTLEYAQVGLHEDIFEFVGSMIYTRDTKFQVEIDCPRNLMVQTDKLRFQQVVLNLARNAAKFVDEGFIRLRADVIKGSVHVFIEDSGPGIPEDKRDHLFSRFQQSLDSLAQGTGVGLNLCKYLVELMGGEIYLDDSYDSGFKGHPGARIVINLKQNPEYTSDPVLLASDHDSETDVESNFARGSSRLFSSGLDEHVVALPEGMSVLFVDDDRILRKQGVRAMERIAPSWKCREAASGETALQIVEEESFDFIFMDQYMTSVEQSMKGTETARALRARGVKSIIMGLSGNDMREAFLSAGADAFHIKPLPCRENELRKVLVELLTLKEVRTAEPNTPVLSSVLLYHDDEA
jgi:CheY-like chemotaxis protein